MSFLASWSINFQALIPGTVITIVSITFCFKIVNFPFLLEGGMITNLNKFYFTRASIVFYFPNNDGI